MLRNSLPVGTVGSPAKVPSRNFVISMIFLTEPEPCKHHQWLWNLQPTVLLLVLEAEGGAVVKVHRDLLDAVLGLQHLAQAQAGPRVGGSMSWVE